MANEAERAQGRSGRTRVADASVRKLEQGVARPALPAVDAVTAGHGATRQPEHVAPDRVAALRPERPGVVVSGDEQVELASRAHQLRPDRLASDQIAGTPGLVALAAAGA
jgi:hypothetical protein